MSKLFSRGFDDVKKAKEQQEQNSGFELFDFYVKGDGEEAPFMFLTEEPINWDSHTFKNSRGYYQTVLCTGEDCPHCDEGDRPRFVASFLVLDLRSYTYEKDGEEVTKEYQVKLYTQGTRVVSQIDRLSNKYGLLDRIWTLIRIGTGKATTYTFERDEEQELDMEQIGEILPEFLEDDFDGTRESLYKIVENQIKMKAPANSTVSEEEAEKNEENVKDKLVGVGSKKKEDKSEKSKLKTSKSAKSKLGSKKKSKKEKSKKKSKSSLFKK